MNEKRTSPLSTKEPGHGRVLEHIVERRTTTRRSLSKATGLTQPTITRIVQDLMEHGLVREGEKLDAVGAGRRPSEIELIPDAALALGIHISASSIELGLVGINGELAARRDFTIRPGEPEVVVRQVAESYQALLDEQRLDRSRVLGAGVGMAGVVDRKGGTNRFAFNLAWRDVPVRQLLATALEHPVVVESNARAMAIAERRFGIGRSGVRNFLFLLVSSGVGAAVIINGRLHRGTGFAGEIGHTSVDPFGPQCACGGRGCLEMYVSDPRTLERVGGVMQALGLNERIPQRVEDLADLLGASSDISGAVAETGVLLGGALAHAVDLLDLDAVIVEGQLFGLSPVLPQISARLGTASLVARVRGLPVQQSTLGHSIGVVGSASLVLDRFFQSPLSHTSQIVSVKPSLSI